MDQLNHIAGIIALTMGVAWASGINLYAAIAMLGILGISENIVLPPGLQILANPPVIIAAVFMYFVEFAADKIPGVDTGWDGIHTFIRIPAGAILAAGAVGDVNPAISLTAAIIGGGMATGAHITKAGTRVIINASPEPVSNWTASITEDIAVIGGLWAALYHPWVFLGLLILFIITMAWAIPRIWRGIKGIFEVIVNFFKRKKPDSSKQIEQKNINNG
ncbi:MAG: DUF4126 domain-containing protein [Deltaproteobacteria bacterium]|nr:DUF4126 domain-containing protein [Deltaproteobacteria bacterium]MBW1814684.1 DUF4126 domain-containing protein [Deltaproteobacteria bacterium]MBW2178907.1 DUF4126 domain-containing protein [Deltaproteobacteria bacterium]MBW2363767.1 DUF4126 domain-containing protein [Deltaproteobacteria bacterium]